MTDDEIESGDSDPRTDSEADRPAFDAVPSENGDRGSGIVTARIDPDPETAEYDLLAVVADLEGVAIDELPSFYDQVDHFVQLLFRNPPSAESQMEIGFSYAGYRITLNRSGELTLRDPEGSAADP